MRLGVDCANACGRCLRGTCCRMTIATPMRPCSLRGATRQGGLERRLRLVATHATSDPNRTPDASLNEIALKNYGKPYNELEPAERRWCITKNASNARWQGHQLQSKPKPEDDAQLQRIAQEMFGKPYQDLDTNQKKACAGKKGSSCTQAADAANRKDKPVDPILQQIAQELFGKDLAELTAEELRTCISTKAAHARWEGHEGKPGPEKNEELQKWAQQKFGRPYEQLSPQEKKACIGKMGAAQKYSGPEFQIDYSAMPHEEALERIAQERCTKPYSKLDRNQRRNVSCVLRRRIKALQERNQAMGAVGGETVDPNCEKPDQNEGPEEDLGMNGKNPVNP